MGSLISLPIAFLIQKVFNFRLNANIFGHLISKLTQKFSKKSNHIKKRFDFFDPRALNDLKKIGLMPNEKEFEFELPNQVRTNLLFGSLFLMNRTFILQKLR